MRLSTTLQSSLAPLLLLLLGACGTAPPPVASPITPVADAGSPTPSDAGATISQNPDPGPGPLAADAGAAPIATPDPIAPLEGGAALARADRDFAVRLYATQKSNQGNLFFSPASARVALAMTYNGARGETAAQMAKALGFTKDATHASGDFGALAKGWNANLDPKVKLNVVNRLWGQRDKEFVPAFIEVLSNRFAAPLERLDFVGATEPSRLKINGWVEDKTEHLIKDLLAPGDITGRTRLVLTNAIYFKGEWQSGFKKEWTRDGTFHKAAESDVRVPLMNQTAHFAYGEVAGAKLLSLPYGAGGTSMVIVLPNEIGGLAGLERGLDTAWLEAGLTSMRTENVSVVLPKFTTTARTSLKPALASMGMPLAFRERFADFSGMDGELDPDKRLFIADVIQKAFVKVDEKGTEAAAATAVIMAVPTSAMIEIPKTFHADHPFVYFIRDNAGNVLFMGRMSDPSN